MQALVAQHKGAVGLEEQARACEYDALFGFDALRPQLLEHMPVLDEAKYARSLAPAAAIDMSAEPAAVQVSEIMLQVLCMGTWQLTAGTLSAQLALH